MRALSVRSLPDEVYEQLKQMARRNHRSLQGQVKAILEKEVRILSGAPPSPLRWRERLKNRPWGNIVFDIRLERSR